MNNSKGAKADVERAKGQRGDGLFSQRRNGTAGPRAEVRRRPPAFGSGSGVLDPKLYNNICVNPCKSAAKANKKKKQI